MSSSYRKATVLVALTLFVIAFALSCGTAGSTRRTSQTGASSTARSGKMTLAQAFSQIDAYPVPRGVGAERWTQLTARLKQQLASASADGKTVSSAPMNTNNSVTDLVANPNAGATQATLTWGEKLWGDYNNDGSVDIADLGPLAQYYGQRTDSGPNDAHMVVNGDLDPEINISDLGAIVADYTAHLQGYQVWRGHWNGTAIDWETTPRPNIGSPGNTNWSIDRTATPPVGARPSYTYDDDISSVADKANIRYKVTPYGDGAPGVDGSVVVMPPPVASRLQGTILYNSGGLAGVTVTLTPGGQNATTDASGAYEIIDVYDGSYTLTPSLAGYTFVPPNRSITVSGTNQMGLDFVAQTVHSYSGTVTFGMSGLAGVTITLTPGGSTATTQADGTYTLTASVVLGQACTLTPAKSGYSFTPPNRPFTASPSDLSGQDFTATQPTLATTPWPKFHGSATNSGQSAYTGAQTNTVKWSHTFNSYVDSSQVIDADGTVYVAVTSGGNSLYALNPADGSIKWSGGMAAASTASTPAIAADGAIYYGTNDGMVYALNTTDGSVRWSRNIGSPPVGSPAIAPNGTIYIGNNGSFFALSPADGSNAWGPIMLGNVQSSPAIAPDGTLYVSGSASDLKAFNSDGTLKWDAGTIISTKSSPALSPDGATVYIGSDNGALYAVDTSNGNINWTTPFGSPGNAVVSSPAVASNGTIYIGSAGGVLGLAGVLAIDPATGNALWEFITDPLSVASSPAIGADGTIYVGCDDGIFYALNPANGSIKWWYGTGNQVKSSPAIAADGTVYVGSDDNKVYAFGP